MKVLLDTCTVIWATLAPSSLSQQAKETIADEGNVVLVSAASAWEIATKVRAGKLPGAIDTESALRAGRLVADHRDPFDRMIAAQALALDVPVLSPDSQFDQFGVRRMW